MRLVRPPDDVYHDRTPDTIDAVLRLCDDQGHVRFADDKQYLGTDSAPP